MEVKCTDYLMYWGIIPYFTITITEFQMLCCGKKVLVDFNALESCKSFFYNLPHDPNFYQHCESGLHKKNTGKGQTAQYQHFVKAI